MEQTTVKICMLCGESFERLYIYMPEMICECCMCSDYEEPQDREETGAAMPPDSTWRIDRGYDIMCDYDSLDWFVTTDKVNWKQEGF